MTQELPLISILLPIRNAQETLLACLESLFAQTYDRFEIIAIDDHSRDNSYKILRELRKRDHRLIISRNKKNYGLAITLNRAMKKAKGDFIAFMNATDENSVSRLERQIRALLKNDKLAAVGTQCYYASSTGKRIGKSIFPMTHEEITHTLLSGLSVHPETVMIKRSILPKDILYFKKTTYPLIYTDVLMKIAQYKELANLSQALTLHKNHTPISLPSLLLRTVKMWLTTALMYDFRPSFRSLVSPLSKSLS